MTWSVRKRIQTGARVALALGAGMLPVFAAHPAEDPVKAESAQQKALPGLPSVLADLRKGGFVIYFRHGPTDVSSGASDEKADIARCETQRNLSAAGREQATATGQAFRTLKIPVGTVLSSPFCRCKDTAKLAFGRHTVDNDLYFAINVGVEERAKLADNLRRLLTTAPAKGTNTIIVSHTANLREAAGIWPKPEGVAYVFRPLPGNRFEAIAMVLPDDWAPATAAKTVPAKK